MKSRYILMSVAAAAMTFVSCVKENINDIKFSEVTLNAVTEGSQTKTALTGFADVVWATGDQIAVYDGAAFTDFILSSGAGTASAGFSGTLAEGKTATAAVYPASAKGTDMTTVKYPAEYAYSEMGVNAPMVASVVEGVLQFKHVGGVVKFDVGNIPPTAAGFVFTANSKITGSFAVTGDAVSTTAGEAESVKISFTPASMKSAVFMVPLPTGTYTGFSVKFVDGSGADISGTVKEKAGYSFTIARKQLLAFPAFVDNTSPARKVLWEGEFTSESYGGFSISKPTFAEGDILRITYNNPTNGHCILLSDPSWNNYTVDNDKYVNIDTEKTSVDVVITAELAAAMNEFDKFILQANNIVVTEVEFIGNGDPEDIFDPETVLWTGSQNAGGFAWFNSNGQLPITLTDGDVLCFSFEPVENAEYTAVNICNGWDGGAIKAKFNGSGTATYGEIAITQDIIESLTDTPRISINNIILNKIVLRR